MDRAKNRSGPVRKFVGPVPKLIGPVRKIFGPVIFQNRSDQFSDRSDRSDRFSSVRTGFSKNSRKFIFGPVWQVLRPVRPVFNPVRTGFWTGRDRSFSKTGPDRYGPVRTAQCIKWGETPGFNMWWYIRSYHHRVNLFWTFLFIFLSNRCNLYSLDLLDIQDKYRFIISFSK